MKNIFLLCTTTTIIQTILLFFTFSSAHQLKPISSSFQWVPNRSDVSAEALAKEEALCEGRVEGLSALVLQQIHNEHARKPAKTGPSAITWKPSGGRFGDDLSSYSRAKLLSLEYNIPLLCIPSPYFDELMLYEHEIMLTEEHRQQFSKIVQLTQNPPYDLSLNNNTLYVCRWKTEIIIDWFDRDFLAELKKNITPRYEIETVTIPDGVVSIAAHVRNGGTFPADTPAEKERCPLRFVPEEFFIDQVERLAAMFPEDNLYVYIFTDHPEPKKLAKKFKKALNNPRITFDYRKSGNSHKANVLEDFFSMMDFDCLIRPGSQFTRFVQRLGNNKVVIYPESVKEIASGKKVIDTIKVKTRTNTNDRWKTQNITIA